MTTGAPTISLRERLRGNTQSTDWLDNISRQNESLLASSSASNDRPSVPVPAKLPGPIAALPHRRTFWEAYRLAAGGPTPIGISFTRQRLVEIQALIDQPLAEPRKSHNGDVLAASRAVKKRI